MKQLSAKQIQINNNITNQRFVRRLFLCLTSIIVVLNIASTGIHAPTIRWGGFGMTSYIGGPIGMANAAGFDQPNYKNVITEDYFGHTLYFEIVKAFWEGMQFSTKYKYAKSCREEASLLVNDFRFLFVNYTTPGGTWDGQWMNISAIISDPFRKTFDKCFRLNYQIQENLQDMFTRFIDFPSFLTSFLFNLLEKSIALRDFAYDLIDYEYMEDWVRYSRSLAGIFRSVIYFDYSGDFLDAEGDPDSPYIVDANGDVHRKEHIAVMKPIHNYLRESDVLKGMTHAAREHMQTFADHTFNKYGPMPEEDVPDVHNLEGEQNKPKKRTPDTWRLPTDPPRKHPIVQQSDEPSGGSPINQTIDLDLSKYDEFGLFTVLFIIFGILDGFVNAMPSGQLIKYCGKFNSANRKAFFVALENYEKRFLFEVIQEIVFSMSLFHYLCQTCWYGILQFVLQKDFVQLFLDFENQYVDTILMFFANFYFNIGYMFIDITMITIGFYTLETESNIFYYMAFYFTDFGMRFLFKETSGENCWYPWNRESQVDCILLDLKDIQEYDDAINRKTSGSN